MSFDWDYYLDLARVLVRQHADYFDQFGANPGTYHIDKRTQQALALAEAVIAALPRLAPPP